MSIRYRLAVLVLTVLIPAFGSCLWLLHAAHEREVHTLDESLRDSARALSKVVEGQLLMRERVATVLAASPLLDQSPDVPESDLRRFYDQAKAAVAPMEGWVALAERQGLVFNTLVPFGEKFPARPAGETGSYGFATDRPLLTGLRVGNVSKRLAASLEVPVKRNGLVAFNVHITVVPAELQKIVDDTKVPEGWAVSILDAEGTVVARNVLPQKWVGQRVKSEVVQTLSSAPEGRFDVTSLDGVPMSAMFSRSDRYGWSFVIAVPEVGYAAILRRSFAGYVGFGVVLLAASLLLAIWMAQRISEPLAALKSQANTLASGRRIDALRTGISECDSVSEVLSSASVAIAHARDSLEAKVAAAVKEAERSGEQLRQLQKMEAVGQLTGGLAHDFNNLLAGISGNLELLDRRIAQSRYQDAPRHIEAAKGATKRAAALTHRLLAFARRQVLERSAVDCNVLVSGMEELLRRMIGPSIEIVFEPEEGLWLVETDVNQLENSLLNLCINSRDAMPSGGRLTIRTANRHLDETEAAQAHLAAGDYVLLCVEDTGTGMNAETRERIFEPFFTTKPLGMGTGLGMSMVYGFVRQSGGHVSVDSTLGRGTSVCMVLPRLLAEAKAPPDAAPAADLPSAASGLALVVDDDGTVREVMAQVLGEIGFQVLEAEDGVKALDVLRSDAALNLLVTDVGLPGPLNGRQVADAARALRPDLKVLFVTGYAESAVIDQGQFAPGMEILTKPFTLAELAARVTRMTGALEPAGDDAPAPERST